MAALTEKVYCHSDICIYCELLVAAFNVFVMFVYIYIYIYIYMSVCVCVCALFLLEVYHSADILVDKLSWHGMLNWYVFLMCN